jgi:hypothetical protein
MTNRQLRNLLIAHFAVIEDLPGAGDWRPQSRGRTLTCVKHRTPSLARSALSRRIRW